MDDPALVEALRAGDPQAPRLLIEQYQGIVFGLCYRMMNHQQDAEDVAQETFVRALRAMAGFDAARPIRPWLLEIAANRCRTALVRRSRRSFLSLAEPTEELADNRARPADPDELADELERASRLSARIIDWCLSCFMNKICRTTKSRESSPGRSGLSKPGSIAHVPSWRNI